MNRGQTSLGANISPFAKFNRLSYEQHVFEEQLRKKLASFRHPRPTEPVELQAAKSLFMLWRNCRDLFLQRDDFAEALRLQLAILLNRFPQFAIAGLGCAADPTKQKKTKSHLIRKFLFETHTVRFYREWRKMTDRVSAKVLADYTSKRSGKDINENLFKAERRRTRKRYGTESGSLAGLHVHLQKDLYEFLYGEVLQRQAMDIEIRRFADYIQGRKSPRFINDDIKGLQRLVNKWTASERDAISTHIWNHLSSTQRSVCEQYKVAADLEEKFGDVLSPLLRKIRGLRPNTLAVREFQRLSFNQCYCQVLPCRDFAKKLFCRRTNKFTADIWNKLSKRRRRILRRYVEAADRLDAAETSKNVLDIVVGVLNRVLKHPGLYELAVAQKARLRFETHELAGETALASKDPAVGIEYQGYLNRLVLEDFYRDELRQCTH